MKRLFLILTISSICAFANAQMAQFEALYIYNFAKNTNWPQNEANNDFVITVIGDNDLSAELTKLSKAKMIGNRKVVINQAATTNNLPKSNIIVLGESKSAMISNLVNSQRDNKTMIVSGKNGLCAVGACISFVGKGGKLEFEISEHNINQAGLSVTQKLLSLGTKID